MRARRGPGQRTQPTERTQRTPRPQQHGLSPAKFERLLEVQGGSCAVCGALFDALPTYLVCIDHDHAHCDGPESCGECVRGIVCHGCNTRIARYEAGHLVNWTPGMLSAIQRYLAAPPAQHLSRRTVQVHARPESTPDRGSDTRAGTPEPAPASAAVPDLGQAVAIVLRAAESGELDRDDVARIVAARWDLTGDAWLHLMADGTLHHEKPPTPKNRPARSVQHRAD